VQWLASGLGGYVAGRLRTKWANTRYHEVFFRDTALASNMGRRGSLWSPFSPLLPPQQSVAAFTACGDCHLRRITGRRYRGRTECQHDYVSGQSNHRAIQNIDMLFRSPRSDSSAATADDERRRHASSPTESLWRGPQCRPNVPASWLLLARISLEDASEACRHRHRASEGSGGQGTPSS